MSLFVLGMRRSGTTIVLDALREDPALRCFYEPLREEAATEGGGSGARAGDAFAETRELRRRYREREHPRLAAEDFNCGGPRAPELELEPELPPHCAGLIGHLLAQAAEVAIKETRLHHKLEALAALAPDASIVHVVRDPRAVCASMLLGRQRRDDLYPDADAFFTALTRRRLWSSRAIAKRLIAGDASLALPEEPPDFVHPLLVWKAAFEATREDGRRLFGHRYAELRLEDLRRDPEAALARVYALLERPAPPPVVAWADTHVRHPAPIPYERDPRWARAARALRMEAALSAAGYGELLRLETGPGRPLASGRPRPRSKVPRGLRRARRRLRGR